jgi:hypothetical protein
MKSLCGFAELSVFPNIYNEDWFFFAKEPLDAIFVVRAMQAGPKQ